MQMKYYYINSTDSLIKHNEIQNNPIKLLNKINHNLYIVKTKLLYQNPNDPFKMNHKQNSFS